MNKLIRALPIAVMLCFVAVMAYAQTINSKGTTQAPVAVGTAAVTVLDYSSGRKQWCLTPETVAIRCTFSFSSSAPTVTPSATAGYFFPLGVRTCHDTIPTFAATSNPQQDRIDCFVASGSTATNVDTWEE